MIDLIDIKARITAKKKLREIAVLEKPITSSMSIKMRSEFYGAISRLVKYEEISKEEAVKEVAKYPCFGGKKDRKRDKREQEVRDKEQKDMEKRKTEYVQNALKARKTLGLKNNVIPTGLEGTEGFQNHHINHDFIIALPSFIHKSIYHRFKQETYKIKGNLNAKESMLEINKVALNCLLGKFAFEAKTHERRDNNFISTSEKYSKDNAPLSAFEKATCEMSISLGLPRKNVREWLRGCPKWENEK